MSLDAALNAAISGLRVNQAHVQLVSSNVAHANDPGYSKKTLARESLFLGDNQAGGVSIASYQAAISASLRRQFETFTSTNGLTGTQQDYLSRIQTLLGSSADTAALPQLFNQFTAPWQSFQSQPESAAAQHQVIALGDRLAAEVRRLSAGIDQIDSDIRQDLDASTDALNDKLAKVGEGVYFACCDFTASDGKTYDLDFFMSEDPHGLAVSEIAVHKVAGVPRYGWQEKGGVWTKVAAK